MDEPAKRARSSAIERTPTITVTRDPTPSVDQAGAYVGAALAWALGGFFVALIVGFNANRSTFGLGDWLPPTEGLAALSALIALAIPAAWMVVLTIRAIRSQITLSDSMLSIRRARSTVHLPLVRVVSMRRTGDRSVVLTPLDAPPLTVNVPAAMSKQLESRIDAGQGAGNVDAAMYPPANQERVLLARWLGRLSGVMFISLAVLSVLASAIDRDAARSRVVAGTVLEVDIDAEEHQVCVKAAVPMPQKVMYTQVCKEGSRTDLDVEDDVMVETDPSDRTNTAFADAGHFEVGEGQAWAFFAIAATVLVTSSIAAVVLVSICVRRARRARS